MNDKPTPEDLAAVAEVYNELAPVMLRDLFAAAAMQAIVAKAPLIIGATENKAAAESQAADYLARVGNGSYMLADAMLRARKGGGA